jgi:diguanylate cyclase (GGDEF)-like protein/PAS domain S-box-containing protein
MNENLPDIHGRKVLIVDDIPANLGVAVSQLEDDGFQVFVAQDGEEGIARAKLVQPDLILLDVMMPGIDGFETCRRLKRIDSTRDIPVIFMTALSGINDEVAGFSAGGVDYITKPFRIEELLARVRTHLKLRSAQLRLAEQNAQLRRSETRYRQLFETSKDGILLLDSKSGRITDVNAAVVKMLGYGRAHFLNHRLWDIAPFKAVPGCPTAFAELQANEYVSDEHWRLETQSNSLIDVEFVGNVYQVDGARILQCNLRDITSRKMAEARIRHMALHDSLTGLPNRILLYDLLIQAIALGKRNQQPLAVLMLDLDHFKHVNDSLGHGIGDGLLEAMAARLKACLRESDLLARLGGDEFVILLPVVADHQDIENVTQKIFAALREPFQVEGHELQIGASIGIAQSPGDGENPEALLRAADVAMYASKAKGRGIHSFSSPEQSDAAQRRILLTHDLHHACKLEQFVLYYQPQISTSSGAITGVEALLRWNHPQNGLVAAAEFVPLLEELGLIVEVGSWVLKTACLQCVAWQKEGLPLVRMAVNVSAQQLYRGDLVRTVERVLRETHLDPRWLELELTESLALNESETTMSVMNGLKRLGVNLSLDDFGTGWSYLSQLRRLPLDRIKIDQSFMRDLIATPPTAAVVNSILDLAQNLGLSCVAEGVETSEQFHYLEEKHCAEVQGLLCPALPAADCAELIRSGRPGLQAMPGMADALNGRELEPSKSTTRV